ncbi:superoxide dismutase family protein [Rubrivirga sp. IMCC43871]|uniref:superoxide dismutase family protein n=1 Tax=Rubrivirga sp. IMCC43871 TaxID=3391575 RepID=UPI00398FB1BB
MPPTRPLLTSAALFGLAIAACDPAPPAPAPVLAAADSLADSTVAPAFELDVQGVRQARATIEPVGRGDASGTIALTRVPGGVRVLAELSGLSPQGFHAVQVLRARGCDGDPGIHLGAETGAPHGGIYSPPGLRHAGDLGNIRGDGRRGRYDRVDPVLPLDGTGSAVGRAVVVRAAPDDAASPDGAAGDVIGCGVFEVVR